MASDYLALNDAAFDHWFRFMNQYVDQKCSGDAPAWTQIPQAARAEMTGLYTAWAAAYNAFLGPHTKVDTELKNKAKKAAKSKIRPFVNQYLRFPPVTDEDRTAIGIPNHDPKPSPVPRPDDIPEVEISTPHPRIVRIAFRWIHAKRWGKPPRVHGLECLWVMSDKQPAKLDELIHSAFATKNPLELSFDEDQRGKRIWFAVRWETGAVKKGDWSDIFSAIVP